MPISSDLLGDGEEVLVDLRPHWVYFFGPAAVTALALAAALAVVANAPHAPTFVAWVLVVMVLVPACWLAGRLSRWLGTSLVVTTSRLILRRGILGRDLVQLRLQRITEIHCTQNLLQRVLGTGRLVIEVTDDEGLVAIDDVRRPRALQRVLTGQLEGPAPAWGPGAPTGGSPNRTPPLGGPMTPYPAAGAPGPAPGAPGRPAPATSIPEQLIQLDDLRRRGILTDAEFEAKKAELLSRL